jgi:hypothetical protein
MLDAGTSVAFMERLSALPLREWHRIAMATPKEISRELECALTGALDVSANAFEGWRVRDGVATLLFRFECAEGRLLTRPRGTLAHIRCVTERAALAVLVRGRLAEPDFVGLIGGFAELCG